MRRHLLALAAATALFHPAVAMAQDRDAEVAALRAQLDAAKATIDALEKRLTAVEGSDAQPKAQDNASTDSRASSAAEAVDLDTLPARTADVGVAEGPELRSWELAPPGPLDHPFAPASDGSTAAFELVAGTGAGRASFALTRSRDSDLGPPTGGAVTPVNNTVNLTFSAPLAKEGDTPFATLDGLSTGTKLEIGFTRFRGRILTQAADSQSPILIRARQRCNEAKPKYAPGCVRLDKPFRDRFMTPDERDEYDRDYARRTIQASFAWSLRAAIGYDEFSYYPLPSLAKVTDEKVSWSVGAGAIFFPFDRTSAAINLDYQRSFKARTAVTTCPLPAAGATALTCVPGPLLGPESRRKLLLAPSLRHLLPISDDGLVRNLGFAPKFEFDFLSDDLSIDVPIYFASDAKSGLIGGGRIGYTTDGDDVKFGIFIGKTFSIFQ